MMNSYDSIPTMINSPMMTPEDKSTTSWGQYYSDDHECEYWYNEETGESTWESPHMKKQYSVDIQEDDYTPVMNFSSAEESQESSSMFCQSSRRALITALDKECDTTTSISDQLLSIKGDENVPTLVKSISTESLYKMPVEEKMRSPIEVSWQLLADRRKSRVLKKGRTERKQRRRIRMISRMLPLFMILVCIGIVCVRNIQQPKNIANMSMNQESKDETIINIGNQSANTCNLDMKGIENSIDNMMEEISNTRINRGSEI